MRVPVARNRGAWMGAAMRHMRISFVRVLGRYRREICRREDGTWQIVTGGRP